MMTSRAEYRLLLRQDNADLRLSDKGYQVGLKTEEENLELQRKRVAIKEEVDRLKKTRLGTTKVVQDFLSLHNSSSLRSACSLAELLCRPELDYDKLGALDGERKVLPDDVICQVEIEIKYEGYIERQNRQVSQFKKNEKRKIPDEIDYDDIISLRLEARQKLKMFKPLSVGQASRISGVSPADIAVLLVYLEKFRKRY